MTPPSTYRPTGDSSYPLLTTCSSTILWHNRNNGLSPLPWPACGGFKPEPRLYLVHDFLCATGSFRLQRTQQQPLTLLSTNHLAPTYVSRRGRKDYGNSQGNLQSTLFKGNRDQWCFAAGPRGDTDGELFEGFRGGAARTPIYICILSVSCLAYRLLRYDPG